MAYSVDNLTERKSILLAPQEKKRYERLAQKHGVSFGELARVAIDSYERQMHLDAEDEAAIVELVNELNTQLDSTHKQVKAALKKANRLLT